MKSHSDAFRLPKPPNQYITLKPSLPSIQPILELSLPSSDLAGISSQNQPFESHKTAGNSIFGDSQPNSIILLLFSHAVNTQTSEAISNDGGRYLDSEPPHPEGESIPPMGLSQFGTNLAIHSGIVHMQAGLDFPSIEALKLFQPSNQLGEMITQCQMSMVIPSIHPIHHPSSKACFDCIQEHDSIN
ncbi:Hypothetical predicted protein [Olea europaea subsp. europaea]|uniref:Uncharacterized protein n=1 Tax=Olea europaea subsp. europaea TaxID=158383 RepID=A0A8S0SYY7_OLEEU|nr:Hypothetical predicted protein [Olea europaea subsp. europaea]